MAKSYNLTVCLEDKEHSYENDKCLEQELKKLSKIKKLRANLRLINLSWFTELSLEEISGNLEIVDCALEKGHLSSLKKIKGDLVMENSEAGNFENLEFIGGNLIVTNSNASLPALVEIAGTASIENQKGFRITKLKKLKKLNGQKYTKPKERTFEPFN